MTDAAASAPADIPTDEMRADFKGMVAKIRDLQRYAGAFTKIEPTQKCAVLAEELNALSNALNRVSTHGIALLDAYDAMRERAETAEQEAAEFDDSAQRYFERARAAESALAAMPSAEMPRMRVSDERMTFLFEANFASACERTEAVLCSAQELRDLVSTIRDLRAYLPAALAAERRKGRDDGLREAAQIIKDMTDKWGDPSGAIYDQGAQDHGHRCYHKVRALLDHTAPDPAAVDRELAKHVVDLNRATPTPQPGDEENGLSAVRELVALVAKERGGLPGDNCADEPDDEPTSVNGNGKPDPITFGHIRRAVAALARAATGPKGMPEQRVPEELVEFLAQCARFSDWAGGEGIFSKEGGDPQSFVSVYLQENEFIGSIEDHIRSKLRFAYPGYAGAVAVVERLRGNASKRNDVAPTILRCVEVATLDGVLRVLRSQDGTSPWNFDMDAAPKKTEVWIATVVGGEVLVERALWHTSGMGFWEISHRTIRKPFAWQCYIPVVAPPPPSAPAQEVR